MNDGFFIQITIGILLFIITGIMAYMARSLMKVTILESSIEKIEQLLERISEDLRTLAKHDSSIAVLNAELANLKTDNILLFEKVRELERNDKYPLSGGQRR